MIVWSLFDGSGIMGLPWAEAGHTVYCFNAEGGNHGTYAPIRMEHENLYYVNQWIGHDFEEKARHEMGLGMPSVIFAFPDCTELAVSGAKHNHQGVASIHHAAMVQALAEKYNAKWMVENPVGKMSTLWRRPDDYFHPFEFGAWLNPGEGSFHPKMPEYDGYTKKTCLWHGGGFVMPPRKPGPINIGHFWGWKSLGGASAKTKQLRSLTPRGFARAVFEANK